MKRLVIPALVAATAFSSNAFADHGWDDGDRWEHRHHRRGERVVVQQVYEAPPVVYQAPPTVVYQAPPQVIYRDRVVYRDRPVYYEAPQQYYEPRPQRYYEQPASYPSSGGNRLVGQAVGAVAGGVIGNQFGQGNGRVAATAIGAVVGSVIGGNVADYGRPY